MLLIVALKRICVFEQANFNCAIQSGQGSADAHWTFAARIGDVPNSLDADQMHSTCLKLWTEIWWIRQYFKGDLIKFCEIFTKITLELLQNSQKTLFKTKKLVINTTKCNLCLFLDKMCLKILWDWQFLWELPSRWVKFCEIYLTQWDMACM